MSESEAGVQSAVKADDDVEIKESAGAVEVGQDGGDEAATPLPLGKILSGLAAVVSVIALVVIAVYAMNISSEVKKQTCYARLNVTAGPPPAPVAATASKKDKQNAFFAGRKRANEIKACAA